MKPKTTLFFIGLAVLLLGVLPLLKFIQPINNIIKNMPAAGSTIYQLIIAIIGLLAVIASLQKRKAVQIIQK